MEAVRLFGLSLALVFIAVGCSESTAGVDQQVATEAASPAAPQAIAQTPEEAVGRLEVALKSADFDAMVEIYAEPYGPKLIKLNLAEELSKAQVRLARAMHSRFGDEAGELAGIAEYDPTEQVKRVKSITVSDQHPEGDNIMLMVRTVVYQEDGKNVVSREEPLLAVPQDGGWRLIPPYVQQQGEAWLDDTLAEQKRVAGCLETVSQEIESGKYNSLDEIQTAVRQSVYPETSRTAARPSDAPADTRIK